MLTLFHSIAMTGWVHKMGINVTKLVTKADLIIPTYQSSYFISWGRVFVSSDQSWMELELRVMECIKKLGLVTEQGIFLELWVFLGFSAALEVYKMGNLISWVEFLGVSEILIKRFIIPVKKKNPSHLWLIFVEKRHQPIGRFQIEHQVVKYFTNIDRFLNKTKKFPVEQFPKQIVPSPSCIVPQLSAPIQRKWLARRSCSIVWIKVTVVVLAWITKANSCRRQQFGALFFKFGLFGWRFIVSLEELETPRVEDGREEDFVVNEIEGRRTKDNILWFPFKTVSWRLLRLPILFHSVFYFTLTTTIDYPLGSLPSTRISHNKWKLKRKSVPMSGSSSWNMK